MPEITWTNCADAMPPDCLTYEIIYHLSDGSFHKGSGHTLHFCIKEFSNPDKLRSLLYWIPYTPEKWEDLNK